MKTMKLSKQQIANEVMRAQECAGRGLYVEKDQYLSILHELKVLRFKVCRRNWNYQEKTVKN